MIAVCLQVLFIYEFTSCRTTRHEQTYQGHNASNVTITVRRNYVGQSVEMTVRVVLFNIVQNDINLCYWPPIVRCFRNSPPPAKKSKLFRPVYNHCRSFSLTTCRSVARARFQWLGIRGPRPPLDVRHSLVRGFRSIISEKIFVSICKFVNVKAFLELSIKTEKAR